MNALITICARGGSKGIPGKNIKLLNNKPLIYYSIKIAIAFAELNKQTHIILSTDSDDIKQIVKNFKFDNVDTDYTRPSLFASDTAGKLDAIHDVLKFAQKKNKISYDYIIDLDVTSPLRSLNDILTAFEILKNNKNAYNIFSVSHSHRNPYFNMVQENANGYYELCKKAEFLTRQSAPLVYDMNASFYIYRITFFENKYKGAITDKSLIYLVPHLCFDLDHPIDFEFMSYLIENEKLDFDLIT